MWQSDTPDGGSHRRISVIGCGYFGAAHAASMAELGRHVVGINVDPAKVRALAAGEAPFFEPGLPEIMKSAGATGRLSFSTSIEVVDGARVHFIAVGTPQTALVVATYRRIFVRFRQELMSLGEASRTRS